LGTTDFIIDEISKYREEYIRFLMGYNGSISADPDSPLMGEMRWDLDIGNQCTYIGNMNSSKSKSWTSY